MSVTITRKRDSVLMTRILEIGEDQIPEQIIAMRREKTLSKLMAEINAGALSGSTEERARARAALDRLGFL
ncbi:hypothetical protein B6V73_05575 [Thioclava sp. JM3]|uniref:Uncharacterized protein n=2 Tax=Paracoccaceae TaxID=31989 RepID=A0ABN4X975_9RHOB|nr:hypothetical protein BMG03_07385 [Thioclava nitratireducens]OWY04112.1 hypothetical protein B6V76_06140 [Thioclava sp. IC9]OWY05622.1 hypothetical protein B6V75_05805 [Thioclava sp. F1Mire-8]OWY10918.1 hypothetical protein B6V74_02540 [Thioclava sp. F42-5]OWY18078.1 hypothetical protein B6V73_05575 [Thioclava sp. JM3]